MLPLQDGLEVCRAIRQEGSAVPVLMLTARDAVEARIAGLDSGADDYLTKPFDFGSSWRAFAPSSAAAGGPRHLPSFAPASSNWIRGPGVRAVEASR